MDGDEERLELGPRPSVDEILGELRHTLGLGVGEPVHPPTVLVEELVEGLAVDVGAVGDLVHDRAGVDRTDGLLGFHPEAKQEVLAWRFWEEEALAGTPLFDNSSGGNLSAGRLNHCKMEARVGEFVCYYKVGN